MGKPFKVVYSPDQWNAPNGGVATAWSTPYGGVHVQMPENMIGPQFTPNMNNMLLRNGELRSRPAFHQIMPGPDGNSPILGCGTFLSQSQVLHTFCFTQRSFWQLASNWPDAIIKGQNPWTSLLKGNIPVPPVTRNTPFPWVAYAGNLYYSNGVELFSWDGAATTINSVAFLGTAGTVNTIIGGNFIGELDNHILIAYVYETTLPGFVTSRFANRVRWSNNGFVPTALVLGTAGATFDPTINVNAGLNDFLDVPDIITGLMTLGRVGFVFRQNGITEMTPTGKGIAPFDFNHLWASQHGIGNVYPFSLAQYGNMGIFISFEQIYQLTPGGLQPIGAGARDAIMADLANSTASPKASIDRGFRLGYTYLHYHLRIPQANGTKSWVWSVEEQNWSSWFETGVWPTGMANECWV